MRQYIWFDAAAIVCLSFTCIVGFQTWSADPGSLFAAVCMHIILSAGKQPKTSMPAMLSCAMHELHILSGCDLTSVTIRL